jgi:hypothetical protein
VIHGLQSPRPNIASIPQDRIARQGLETAGLETAVSWPQTRAIDGFPAAALHLRR